MTSPAIEQRATITDLIGRFDVFLIDQFGTLHDGQAPYPGVLAALRSLRRSGARVVLLSNSGKRAAANAARLATLGLPEDCYDRFVTSGEVAWHMLRDGRIASARGVRRCLLLARGDAGGTLDGLEMTSVARADEAQIVVIAGSEGDRRTLDFYATLLAPAARAGLPCLCLNPDRIMLTPTGPAFGAGRIAALYEELGGVVTWIGKPHAAIYDAALAGLGGIGRDRVAGIGDSIEHDIAGAHAAGCRGWLVRTGLAAAADEAALAIESARFGASPDGLLAAFG